MQEIQKMFEKIFRKEMKKDTTTFVKNVLYRYPKARNFTSSDVIHDMHGDHTSFVDYVPDTIRSMAEKGTVIDHPTGPKVLIVKDKGRYGRTPRPQNLYKFQDA